MATVTEYKIFQRTMSNKNEKDESTSFRVCTRKRRQTENERKRERSEQNATTKHNHIIIISSKYLSFNYNQSIHLENIYFYKHIDWPPCRHLHASNCETRRSDPFTRQTTRYECECRLELVVRIRLISLFYVMSMTFAFSWHLVFCAFVGFFPSRGITFKMNIRMCHVRLWYLIQIWTVTEKNKKWEHANFVQTNHAIFAWNLIGYLNSILNAFILMFCV